MSKRKPTPHQTVKQKNKAVIHEISKPLEVETLDSQKDNTILRNMIIGEALGKPKGRLYYPRKRK